MKRLGWLKAILVFSLIVNPLVGLVILTGTDVSANEINYNPREIKTFGGSLADSFLSVAPTQDGGWIAVGSSLSNDGDLIGINKGDYDGIVVKYSQLGNVVWKKSFGGSKEDLFNSVVVDSNGDCIVVGRSSSSDGDLTGIRNRFEPDAIIVKFDVEGNLLWKKCFGGTNRDDFYSIAVNPGGGYVVVGKSISNDYDLDGPIKGDYDAVIVKYDTNGLIIWKKTFGGTHYDYFNSVITTLDGGFIAAGFSNSIGDLSGLNIGGGEAIIVKFDNSGNLAWIKWFGGSKSDYFYSISKTSNGGFIAVGSSFSSDSDLIGYNNKGFSDAIIVKYDIEGNMVWYKSFGGKDVDEFFSITSLPDGGYLVGGTSCSTDGDMIGLHKGANDGIILKYDSHGNVLYKTTIGGSDQDRLWTIATSIDGSFSIAVGEFESIDKDFSEPNRINMNGFVVKINHLAAIIAVTNITLNQSSLSLTTGKTSQLTASIEPEDATNLTVNWGSSNTSVATVDSTGNVTAIGNGTSLITATSEDGDYTATASVTVTTKVTGIRLNKSSLNLATKSTSQLTATISPSTASNKKVSWTTSKSTVATVDTNGKITAVSNGTAVITATSSDGGYKASTTVTVTIPVTGVLIQSIPDNVLNVDDTLSLKATISPSTAMNKNLIWSSSDESIATVSSTGVVTGISDGYVTITAESVDGGYTSSIDITIETSIEYVLAESITINPSSVTLEKDKTAVLKATILPSNTTDKTIVWSSSNPSVAIVNQLGVVKALRKGTAIITATNPASYQSAKVTITVFNTVYTDATDVFDLANPAVAFLEAYDANNKLMSTASGFLISSDGRLVTNLHAILNGTTPIAYMKAIFPDKAYNRITTVLGYDATNDIAILQIDGVSTLPYIDLADPAELKTGLKVLAIGSPAKLENSLTQGIVSSKMRKIADTVYIQTDVGISNGSSGGVLLNMKGEAVGITTAGFGVPSANLNLAIPIESLKVVATNNPKTLSDIKDVQIITVEGIKKYSLKTIVVTSVKFNTSTLTLAPKHTNSLVATVSPSNASNKNVTYTSSNTKVATVDVNGKVTAVAAGTASITVKTKDGNKSAIVSVTVTTPVTSVTLNKSTLSLTAKQTTQLTATINPTTATNKAVTWTSSNTKFATVDSNGKVTAVAKGTTTITVKTTDGSKTATCVVTVK